MVRLTRTLVVAAALCAAAITWGSGGDDDRTDTKPAAPFSLAAAPLPASTPKELNIGSIGLNAKFMTVGLGAGSAIETPPKKLLDTVGWYKGSVSPGEPGSAVVVGHVDSDRERSVFFRLSELKPGWRLSVGRSDGRTAQFTVDERKYVKAAEFPAADVLRKGGDPGLWLMTCAPPYNKKTHRYDSVLMVHSTMTRTFPAKA
ncbi:sortase domain-bontaining protein [Streptomyces fractus]|uniref:sortase domain-containing protein n=1 Tax=Streptomyces fractus TaxID=641806 RepID=UPI003CE745F1